MVAECGDHHVCAHGGHEGRVVERDGDVMDGAPVGVAHRGGRRDHRHDVHVLGGVVADERLQLRDERRLVETLDAFGVDRLEGVAERVEALEEHVDRRALESTGALPEQFEDVLHRVGQRCDALEAHRRAHALEGMRDSEDLADRLRVVRHLFDADDRQVELLEVLAALGEEHRQVFVELHQAFR